MTNRTAYTYGDLTADRVDEADVIIVGAGPGGAAAAARLAESGKRVVILEGGGFYGPGTYPRKSSENLQRMYFEEGQMSASGPTFIPLAAGSGVGGSSLINSAICFRGTAAVLDEWAETTGNPRYSAAGMADKYTEVEQTIGVRRTPDNPDIIGRNNMVALEGARALNLESQLADRNAPGCVGCGVCHWGCPVGGKGSVDLNFLGLRAFTHDCTVYANTMVSELLLEDGRVTGVSGFMRDPETRERGPNVTVRAPRVMLAGGAIGTAKLLLWTGVSDNDHIGRHLHVHPGSGAYGMFPDDIRMWRGVTQGAWIHDPSNPDALLETFSVPTEVLFAQAASSGRAAKDFLGNIGKMAGLGVIIRDRSEGVVTLADGGRASISYDMQADDCQKIVNALRLSARVLFAAGAREVNPGIWYAGYCNSMEQLDERLQRPTEPNDILLYASHLQGTCRMGRTPEEGAVDARGAVWDVPGLYVSDSALFPSALGRNPQMTVMALSLHVAEQLLEDW